MSMSALHQELFSYSPASRFLCDGHPYIMTWHYIFDASLTLQQPNHLIINHSFCKTSAKIDTLFKITVNDRSFNRLFRAECSNSVACWHCYCNREIILKEEVYWSKYEIVPPQLFQLLGPWHGFRTHSVFFLNSIAIGFCCKYMIKVFLKYFKIKSFVLGFLW